MGFDATTSAIAVKLFPAEVAVFLDNKNALAVS
jgi:hypothetical protein